MDDEAVKKRVEQIRTGPLSVEALLESRARSRSTRLRLRGPLSEAKSKTRWAMEQGLYAVLDVRPTADIAKDFETLDKKVQKAHSAIDELLHHLDPDARKGADLALPLLTAQAGIQKNSDARALHDLARHDGECLWMAREVLKRVETAAVSKEVRVLRARPSATKPKDVAFATHLFKCWRLITGAEPGKNLTREKNPSLVYVTAAWVDVFGQNKNPDDAPQFIGALRSLSAEG